jgi:hypothetical protein
MLQLRRPADLKPGKNEDLIVYKQISSYRWKQLLV